MRAARHLHGRWRLVVLLCRRLCHRRLRRCVRWRWWRLRRLRRLPKRPPPRTATATRWLHGLRRRWRVLCHCRCGRRPLLMRQGPSGVLTLVGTPLPAPFLLLLEGRRLARRRARRSGRRRPLLRLRLWQRWRRPLLLLRRRRWWLLLRQRWRGLLQVLSLQRLLLVCRRVRRHLWRRAAIKVPDTLRHEAVLIARVADFIVKPHKGTSRRIL